MSRTSLHIILSITLLTVVGTTWWLFEKRTDAHGSTPSKPDTQKAAFVVKSDLDWSKLPESQLLEYKSHFKDTKPNEQHLWSAEVFPGESVVTSGYQVKPGQFVFSMITPQLRQDENGKNVIEVRNNIFMVSLSGEYESAIDASMKVSSGNSLAWGGGSHLGYHVAHIKATSEAGNPKISLEATESFIPIPSDNLPD